MAFAKQDFDFPYWHRQNKPLYADLAWNIPEQKTGLVNVVGGNAQGFHGVMRFAELLARDFPIKTLNLVFPDALRDKVPPLANLDFATSTESGTFAKSERLNQACSSGDFVVLAGDFSRNSETAAAVSNAIRNVDQTKATPAMLVMRDAVDLLTADAAILLQRPNSILLASMAQLQKTFRSVYYPRMLMLSQPLAMAVETLHKFTLSYPVTILTFHEEQVIVANGGEVSSTPISKTGYSVLSLWSGELAAKVTAYNLYNPTKAFEATTAAIVAKSS